MNSVIKRRPRYFIFNFPNAVGNPFSNANYLFKRITNDYYEMKLNAEVFYLHNGTPHTFFIIQFKYPRENHLFWFNALICYQNRIPSRSGKCFEAEWRQLNGAPNKQVDLQNCSKLRFVIKVSCDYLSFQFCEAAAGMDGARYTPLPLPPYSPI